MFSRKEGGKLNIIDDVIKQALIKKHLLLSRGLRPAKILIDRATHKELLKSAEGFIQLGELNRFMGYPFEIIDTVEIIVTFDFK